MRREKRTVLAMVRLFCRDRHTRRRGPVALLRAQHHGPLVVERHAVRQGRARVQADLPAYERDGSREHDVLRPPPRQRAGRVALTAGAKRDPCRPAASGYEGASPEAP